MVVVVVVARWCDVAAPEALKPSSSFALAVLLLLLLVRVDYRQISGEGRKSKKIRKSVQVQQDDPVDAVLVSVCVRRVRKCLCARYLSYLPAVQ